MCVHDTESESGCTALHILCYFSNWIYHGNSDQSIDEYSEDECNGVSDGREYDEHHRKNLKENFYKSNLSLLNIMDLAQLIVETSHGLLQKPKMESQYKSHHIQQSILLFKDYNGDTPLHTLFRSWNTNVDMMTLLFDSCTKNPLMGSIIPNPIMLILHKNKENKTPLHYASRCVCSFSAWKVLLDQFPENYYSSSRVCDSNGETPLHHALKCGISVRRLQLYLKTFTKKELYIHDKDLDTPLNAIVQSTFDSTQSMWFRMVAIMRAILEHNTPTPPMFALAALSDMIPLEWLELGLQFHKNELLDMDDQGRCPLHVAGMCPSRRRGIGNFLKFLQEQPAVAGWYCHQGRLPLHYVLETGKSLKCVKALLLEYPDGLNELDPVTGLPPFLLAIKNDILTVTQNSLPCSENQINNCYFLLRENPAMILMFHSGY